MAKQVTVTSLMKQYREMKEKHPDAVLLFRIGDFYETFSDDAVIVSDILGITLTRRANGKSTSIELTGFPHHALDTYLPRLVRAGKRVAICEQLEDPKTIHPKVRKMLDGSKPKQNAPYLLPFVSLLIVFRDIIYKLSIFENIRLKTQELRGLASEIGISPIKAFEECSKINQPSLFDL